MSQLYGVEANQVIKVMEPYIKLSAKHASKFYLENKLSLTPFKGVKLTFTPEVCASIYRDLIFDLIKSQCTYRSKYNFNATLVILGEGGDNQLQFTIQLGMIFPARI